MLRIPLSELQLLQQVALERTVETCAVGLVLPVRAKGGVERHVVRQLEEVPEGAYLSRSSFEASLKTEYCIDMANRARAASAGVLLV